MKRNLIKILAFLLALIFNVHPIFAQGVEENPEVRNYLNNMFSTLDKSKVPNGLLKDYAFDLTDLDKFTGADLNDKNYVDKEIYSYLLRTIRSSAVGTKPFGDVSQILVSQQSVGTNNVVSLGGLAYQYSYINENAISDQLINYSNGKVSDKTVNGVWKNPYSSKYVVGFAPHDSIFKANLLTFKLNSNTWFSNLSVSKIEIDYGTGYKVITVGGSLSASFTSGGRKEIKMRVTLTDGQQLVSHSSIQVSSAMSLRTFSDPDLTSYKKIFTGAAYKGVSTTARVFVKTRNGQIRDPFIIVEGFDPILGHEFGSQRMDNTYPYLRADIQANYDIIYVDWAQSEQYIQANANTLKDVIQWVNSQKQLSGSTSGNVVMGSSMGGLVVRYALKTMENQNLTHQTSVYVSHDAPHLGANIPIGALYALHGIGSFLENQLNLGNIYNLATGTPLEYMLKQVHSPAARQMLVNYVDFGGNLNNTDHNLWQQELNTLGFPQGDPNRAFRMIALANGSYAQGTIPSSYLTANATASTDLLDVANIITGGMSAFFVGSVLNDFWAGALSLVPGKSTIKGTLEIFPGTSAGNRVTNLNFKFIKKFLWTVPVTRTIFSYEKNMHSGLNFDAFPSSQFITNRSLNADEPFVPKVPILGRYSYAVSTSESIPFVPTSSALAVGGGTNALTAALFTTKPTSTSTPFGGNFRIREISSGSHIALSDEEVSWLYAQLKMGIDGPKLAKTGTQYKVINPLSGSIIWSTSNSSIATISSSGILTAVGKGIVDIKAKVGTTEISTRVAVGIPRFVLANVKRDPGFYTIKANCIDTEPGYAEFLLNNRDLIVYQWGIKTENQSIQWTDSESSEVKLSTTEDTENTTIYLKIKDYNGNVSSPIFVRITGYDIYDVGFRTFILNKNGQLFTDTGYELYYEGTGMPLVFRSTSFDEFSNAEWSPLAGTIINDQQTQWVVPWYTSFYIKDIITLEEIERIKSTFTNDQVAIYTFYLLNYDGQIIQKTPLSVIYKANYPNP
ncbi:MULTISPECIES: hypothetical protein [unclassified Sphingobacterium]|uniref:hypothetical protein n=1 Tax=unclassified Sphingobacterium TaxID=2609468 RepID=UPI0025F7C5DE|nr:MULTISPECIES: hypothetical protein [unclassified Sphingobacterium]